jgi:hypothetical protein
MILLSDVTHRSEGWFVKPCVFSGTAVEWWFHLSSWHRFSLQVFYVKGPGLSHSCHVVSVSRLVFSINGWKNFCFHFFVLVWFLWLDTSGILNKIQDFFQSCISPNPSFWVFTYPFHASLFIYYLFCQCWGWNPGPFVCEASCLYPPNPVPCFSWLLVLHLQDHNRHLINSDCVEF